MSNVQNAIALLESERARLDVAIEALRGISGNGGAVKRGPGRPRKDAAAEAATASNKPRF